VSETVLALACGIASDHAFDRLPILADALEDAGCDNFTLLSHLRHDDAHDCRAFRRLLRTTLTLPDGVPMVFAFCPAGTFTMSSDVRETAYDERPVRRVTLTSGFWAGVVPVTQAQWRAVCGRAAGRPGGDRRPVESVNWDDAVTFCRLAGRATGKPLRLPTEAEWEYACRGGTTTEYHWGDAPAREHLNCDPRVVWGTRQEPQPRGQTSEVGTYPPNPWGLHDCHGNVWEWCQDYYVPTFYTVAPAVDPVCHTRGDGQRVIRGGSFAVMSNLCRSASRYSAEPTSRSDTLGFRVVFTA
jgi:formylglycine-generating enzyme required for sulfatase activity